MLLCPFHCLIFFFSPRRRHRLKRGLRIVDIAALKNASIFVNPTRISPLPIDLANSTKKFNRIPKERSYHYRNVATTFFECFGNSLIEGIERAVKEFYAKPQQGPFTEELTRDMMIRFLITRKSMPRGLINISKSAIRTIENLWNGFSSDWDIPPQMRLYLRQLTHFTYTKKNRKTKRRSKSRRRTC